MTDGLASNSYSSKDFKPNTGSTQDYGYDDNGNMSANADKRISAIAYNYLNLQEDVSMSGSTGSMTYAYDAVGSKLQQQVFAGSTLESTTDYIGEAVFLGRAVRRRSMPGIVLPFRFMVNMQMKMGNR